MTKGVPTRNRVVSVLTTLMIALMAALATACLGEVAPEPEADRDRQELLDTIEQMDREIDALGKEVEELRDINENRNSTGAKRDPGNDITVQATDKSQKSTEAYALCLDEMFLHWAGAGDHGLAAIVWHCRDLEPEAYTGPNPARCRIDESKLINLRYPEWPSSLSSWYSNASCNPPPDTESHIENTRGSSPTDYTACLDNNYMRFREEKISLHTGLIVWICRDYHISEGSPDTPKCEESAIQQTKELYPEWSDDLHAWNALSQCQPRWQTTSNRNEYAQCLEDLYVEAKRKAPKDIAIPVAVWGCRNHMPEPPRSMNPRCRTSAINRTKEADLEWPLEMYEWYAIAACYPAYSGKENKE